MRARLTTIAVSPLSLLVLLGALALPAQARPVTENASSGQVSAVFGYDFTPTPDSNFGGTYENEQVTITRGGQEVYSKKLCGLQLEDLCLFPINNPTSIGATKPTIEVADIESNGEPDVLVHLVTGGNACCQEDRLFRWDAAASTYDLTERHWPSYVGARLTDVDNDGTLEFESADGRFWAQFASPGGSSYPLQVFIFRAGKFTDVTRRFPTAIAADARVQLRTYRSGYKTSRGGLGQMAAWVADEYLLGRQSFARSTLRREKRLGHLSRGESSYYTKGFTTKLLRLLNKFGYVQATSPATVGGAPPAAPVFARSTTLQAVSGSVRIRLPGTKTFVPLSSAMTVPIGTTIDATNGRVRLTSAKDASGQPQAGLFDSGVFRVSQALTGSPLQAGQQIGLTVLTLAGKLPAGCKDRGATASSKRKPGKIRKLWGNAKGNYRSVGHYAAATVAGTRWLTQDTCTGTLVRVARGVVSVNDLRRHRTVLVKAPGSYNARAASPARTSRSCGTAQLAGASWNVSILHGQLSCAAARGVASLYDSNRGTLHGSSGPRSGMYITFPGGWRCTVIHGGIAACQRGGTLAHPADDVTLSEG